MAPASVNAELVSPRFAADPPPTVALEEPDAGGAVGWAFLLAPPPLEPHATPVTRKARASLHSTRLFYPKEGAWQTPSNPCW
jgi:hypothetical protein